MLFKNIFITYFPQLHFQCYPKSPPCPPPHFPTHPFPLFGPGVPLYWGIYSFRVQWASLSSDGRLGHLVIHMQLESRAPGYWLVHNVVPPIGLQICNHYLFFILTFSHNIPQGVTFLVLSIWCSLCFFHPCRYIFLLIFLNVFLSCCRYGLAY